MRPRAAREGLDDTLAGLGLGLSERHSPVNESGTYEGRLIRDQAAVTAVHTVNARARNIR